MNLTKQFKKGDIVDGYVSSENKYGMTAGTFILFKTSGDILSNGGVPYTLETDMALPLDAVEMVVDVVVVTGPTGPTGATGSNTSGGGVIVKETSTTSTTVAAKKFFTTRNIVIGVLAIALIFGILKLTKII